MNLNRDQVRGRPGIERGLSLALAVLIMSFTESTTRGIAPTTAPQALRVRVITTDGRPLAGAVVQTESYAGQQSFDADPQGFVLVTAPSARRDFLRVTALAPGHTPAWAMWWKETLQGQFDLPTELEFRLRPGITIGGALTDEQGEPIAAAQVELFFQSADAAEAGGYVPGDVVHSLWKYPATSDADGHWTCDMAPAEWREGFIRASHRDFYSPASLTPKKDASALRDQSDQTIMVRGRIVAGQVVDAAGRLIEAATVYCDRSITEGTPQVRTDAGGWFHFAHAQPDGGTVLVTHADFAPQFFRFEQEDDAANLTVRLQTPRIVRGRIVDEANQPIGNAVIMMRGWQEMQSWRREWRQETGSDGRFSFRCPDVPVDFHVAAKGFEDNHEVTLQPRDEEHVVVLQRAVRATGTVTDARTGQPIKRFRVSAGVQSDNEVRWGYVTVAGRDGAYELEFPRSLESYHIRIDAMGYEPTTSDALEPRDGAFEFNARLMPSKD